MRARLVEVWDWLAWLNSLLVTRKRADQWAKDAFGLGVDAGTSGLVTPSQAFDVRHLDGLPSGVVGVEIPPR